MAETKRVDHFQRLHEYALKDITIQRIDVQPDTFKWLLDHYNQTFYPGWQKLKVVWEGYGKGGTSGEYYYFKHNNGLEVRSLG